MRPALHLVTLGVRDLAASRAFYEGLGWPTTGDAFGEVTFVGLAQGPLLSLWELDGMRGEIGEVTLPAAGAAAPVTLAHCVDSPAEVDAVLAEADRAGGTVVSPGATREWGGYSGYFADPDGFRWEVAHNPHLTRDADGTVHLGGV